jgi:predicted ribosomally synthesized peptide with nif11-like leader
VVPADFMSLRGQPIKTAKNGEAHNLLAALRCYDRSEGLKQPMPAEQLKAFLQQAKQDTALQDKLKNSANLETMLAIAKDAGFNISANDVTEMQAELEDKELENASGGGGFAKWFEGIFQTHHDDGIQDGYL